MRQRETKGHWPLMKPKSKPAISRTDSSEEETGAYYAEKNTASNVRERDGSSSDEAQ